MTRPCTLPSRAGTPADAGSIVVGWLLKITIVLVVAAVLVYDAIGVGTAHLRITDDSNLVASTARDALDAAGGTTARAVAMGRRAAIQAGYQVGPQDIIVVKGVVVVHLRDDAETIVLSKIPGVKSWAHVDAVARARSIHAGPTG